MKGSPLGPGSLTSYEITNALFYFEGKEGPIKMVHYDPEEIKDPIKFQEDYLDDFKEKRCQAGFAIISLPLEGKERKMVSKTTTTADFIERKGDQETRILIMGLNYNSNSCLQEHDLDKNNCIKKLHEFKSKMEFFASSVYDSNRLILSGGYSETKKKKNSFKVYQFTFRLDQ